MTLADSICRRITCEVCLPRRLYNSLIFITTNVHWRDLVLQKFSEIRQVYNTLHSRALQPHPVGAMHTEEYEHQTCVRELDFPTDLVRYDAPIELELRGAKLRSLPSVLDLGHRTCDVPTYGGNDKGAFV